MEVLRRILPDMKLQEDEPIPKEHLDKLRINFEDFREALKIVRPSAMREVLVEVPNVKWKDIGGLGFNSITTPAAGFRQIIDEITGANQGGMWFLAGVIGVAGQGIAFIVFTIAILFALFKLLS